MKTFSWTRRCATLAAAACLLGLTSAASANGYPEQPIRLLIGFPPGGGGDLYGRTIANELGKHIGKPIVVENKPGAGGNIAAELMTQAKPDGYTLLLAMSGNLGSAPAIRNNLTYKVPDDFVFISQLVETPYGLVVSGDSKIKTIQDYVAAAKGGQLSYASTGTGGAAQIVMEMVKQQGNLDVLHVPYKGSGPVMTDLMSGLVGSFFAPYTPLMGQINSGKLRVIAVSSEKRVPSMPNVPTLKESGIDVVMTQWYGLVAPKGTPQPIIDKLNKAFVAALHAPETKTRFGALLAEPVPTTPQQFDSFMASERAKYQQVVKASGARVD